ncbi:MAG: alpha-ketoglutarate-dependent dioxygenase AlkB [Candidatus Dormibacteraeota bacterium]|nr:alpha-ketoglutarate-dependent dioxygenase AlkB [Candidatus Dormibacteraeota bacterium]
MVTHTGLVWQSDLFGAAVPEPDRSFGTLVKHRLDATAWVDHAPGWLHGADTLFADLLESAPWATEQQELYGKVMDTPRLIARWPHEYGTPDLPPALEAIRAALEDRYERPFDSVSANLYRDGHDSVAWHGDRIAREVRNPLVCTVSLGHPRRFLMRPRGGPAELRLTLGPGDLVVMGGTSQRTWQHTIPKVASAGPRISIAVRHSR